MSARVTTAVEESGRVLACKRATGPDDAERIRHEAAVLARARHPGVVELASCRDVDGVTTLYTDFVGTHTLETAPTMPLDKAGALVAMLSSTVADLHDLGVVHGRIDLSHVLIGPSNRPILCGFSGGGAEGELAPHGPGALAAFRDPAAAAESPLKPSVDVFGLGTLLRVLVVGDAPDIEPIPERRFDITRRRPWTGYLRRALLTLADQSTDEQPPRRPTARRLAADIEAILPHRDDQRKPPSDAYQADEADVFAAPRPASSESTDRAPARRLTLLGSAVGLVLIFVGLAALRSDDTTSTRSSTASAPTSTTTTTILPTSSHPPPPTSTPTTPTTTDVALQSDGTVSVGGHRFEVGQPGDRIAIGDWHCTGTPTAAIARPSTGEVFVFDRWPSAEGEISAIPLPSVVDAVNVRADQRDGCSVLIVTRDDGSEVEVP